MSKHTFSHGGQLECPECPGSGKGNLKPKLNCVVQSWSGEPVDMGQCEECGKGWWVTFEVKEVRRFPEWDGVSRAEKDARKERERQREVEKEKTELARLKAKYDTST